MPGLNTEMVVSALAAAKRDKGSQQSQTAGRTANVVEAAERGKGEKI